MLRRVQAEERRAGRSRLKVFLGYAPRVGKSLRMFDEGRRRKLRGEDVVVASSGENVYPDDVEASYMLGLVYISMDSLVQAREQLSHAAALEPGQQPIRDALNAVESRLQR